MNVAHNFKDSIVQQAAVTDLIERTPALPNTQDEGSKLWNDIVFEKRNREYGAYILRKGYSNNVVVAMTITILLALTILFFPALLSLLSSNEVSQKAERKKLIYSELSPPPPIDKPKPPPPQIQLPKLQRVIKFVPPKVVKEAVAETAPTIEEIKANDVAAVNIEGPTEIAFDEPVEEVVLEDENEIFTVVEQRPEFEGGYEALMRFVKENMVYPANARRMQIEGTVHVGFIVNKDGSISDVGVLRGISSECDQEAIRVIKLMPKWKPGRQNGRNVNVRFVLPLKFRLS